MYLYKAHWTYWGYLDCKHNRYTHLPLPLCCYWTYCLQIYIGHCDPYIPQYISAYRMPASNHPRVFPQYDRFHGICSNHCAISWTLVYLYSFIEFRFRCRPFDLWYIALSIKEYPICNLAADSLNMIPFFLSSNLRNLLLNLLKRDYCNAETYGIKNIKWITQTW